MVFKNLLLFCFIKNDLYKSSVGILLLERSFIINENNRGFWGYFKGFVESLGFEYVKED